LYFEEAPDDCGCGARETFVLLDTTALLTTSISISTQITLPSSQSFHNLLDPLRLRLVALLEDVESRADVKVPLIDVAGVFDEVGPPLFATKLVSTLDSLDNSLGSFGRRPSTRDDPSAQVNALLQRLEPHRAGNARQLLQALGREFDNRLEDWIFAPALSGSVALAVGVLENRRRVTVGVAAASDRVGFAVLAARPQAVAAGGVDVVAAETLLGVDYVGLVVCFPCGLATGDGGLFVMELGEYGSGED
jgi:hypothetical protein